MLYDDVELYLNDSSASSFDSDSDSGFSTPSQHDNDHPSCFSTPMTPMSPFMENDTEEHPLYSTEEDIQESSSREESEDTKPVDDAANMVIDMKRPMFIPVSICEARDLAAAASLPTPPECNARKHSYDFLRNSDAFLLGGISSTKRRRVDILSAEIGAPASPPASNAGDDEAAEFSDAESSASYFMARRRSLFQMRNVRHLTPTSPSTPEIVCFAPPTHEEYDYHPELDRSDDEDEEEEDEEEEEENNVNNSPEQKNGMTEEMVGCGVPSDLFVVEADQESGDHRYLSEDNYSSSSDDETEFSYHSENEMHIDAMSSSDDSDSDVSDVEDYQFPIRRRGTWHGPSLEDIERAAAKATKAEAIKKPTPPQQKQPKQPKKQQEKSKETAAVTKPATVSETTASTPAPVAVLVTAVVTDAPTIPSAPVKKAASPAAASASVSESKTSKAQSPTLFQMLTKANIDWCRYCGTTEGVNWRPGPWGKRTLCNKHGCDFKGYGFACKLPRLDLTNYAHETVDQRIRPVLQHFCHGCQSQDSTPGNKLVRCEGCPKAFHQACHGDSPISDEIASSDKPWFCDESCRENVKKKRVCVELPKKRLPLMSTPKPLTNSVAAGSAAETPSSSAGRPRGVRAMSGDSSRSK
ncbi:hypothetical protein FBU30_007136 [Linnemannia zychae]|nr:hypothetical protein FBU30_007136 [Linnemannia zychae]